MLITLRVNIFKLTHYQFSANRRPAFERKASTL